MFLLKYIRKAIAAEIAAKKREIDELHAICIFNGQCDSLEMFILCLMNRFTFITLFH